MSTVSTKCETAILQRQHTQIYLGCVSFYRKRYSGLPSPQNKCFLFLNLESSTQRGNGDLCILCISAKMIQLQQGLVHFLYQQIKSLALYEVAVPRLRQESLSNNKTRGTLSLLQTEGFVVDLKDDTDPEIKAQACCITKKC